VHQLELVLMTQDEALKELDSVKKLLIAVLVKLGSNSEEIGGILGVDSSRVRQLVQVKKIKRFKVK